MQQAKDEAQKVRKQAASDKAEQEHVEEMAFSIGVHNVPKGKKPVSPRSRRMVRRSIKARTKAQSRSSFFKSFQKNNQGKSKVQFRKSNNQGRTHRR